MTTTTTTTATARTRHAQEGVPGCRACAGTSTRRGQCTACDLVGGAATIDLACATFGAPGCGGAFTVLARFHDLDYRHEHTFTWHCARSKTRELARAEHLMARMREAGVTREHVDASPHWRAAVAYSYNACDGGSPDAPALVHTFRHPLDRGLGRAPRRLTEAQAAELEAAWEDRTERANR